MPFLFAKTKLINYECFLNESELVKLALPPPPPAVRPYLIPKSNNPVVPKCRLIGVGEAIFRLLGRAILSKIVEDN